MDRDNRWERTQAAYELLTEACGSKFQTPDDAFNFYYTENTSDEFIPPTSFAKRGEESSMSIQDKDSLLFFNFRSDRMKQISKAFFSREDEFDSFISLTQYDATFPIMPLFGPQKIENHFGQVVSKAGLRQVRIAETEKYAHVTYFFNGGEEKEIEGETRIVIPSRKDVATYDLLPEMSAIEVKEALCSAINNNEYDVYIANFANCDMVGHTGSFDAAVAACEVVDQCLGEVVASMQKAGGNLLVTADHGNADQMIEYDSGKPHTYHTTHPVPLVLVSNEAHMTLKDKGALCDIAPTALELMGIEQPTEMTGSSLLAKD
ncbi:UNVERIFIED_CONTAM: hypothetical protein GTU68_054736 [Idotea baltica]|nr:hypothetical protein [Idotea baltica]